ncbi:hypothetical protein [Phocaeicola sp.]
MKVSSNQIGQTIEAAFWYRYGRDGKDYAVVQGTITRVMECYNRILIDIKEVLCGCYPNTTAWINCDKAEIEILNAE